MAVKLQPFFPKSAEAGGQKGFPLLPVGGFRCHIRGFLRRVFLKLFSPGCHTGGPLDSIFFEFAYFLRRFRL